MTERTLQALDFGRVVALVREYCTCEPGRRAADTLRPLDQVAQAAAVYDMVEELGRVPEEPDRGEIADLTPLFGRTGLTVGELVTVLRTVRALRRLGDYFARNRSQLPRTAARSAGLGDFRALEGVLDGALEEPAGVRDTASPELAGLRRGMRRQRRLVIAGLEEALGRTPDLFQTDGVVVRSGRYVLPVKAENRSRVDGIVHETSDKGRTYFVEPLDQVGAQNELARLASAEAEEVRRILADLSARFHAVQDELGAALACAGELDLLFARKAFGGAFRAVRPTFAAAGELAIRSGRHPLLARGRDQPVPLDLVLDGSAPVLLVSGPNAGGKTVVLKTVGLFTLMAKAALPVPADPGTRLPFVDQVFADIGDDSSLDEGLSSYSASLTKTRAILRSATPASLVLLDELGGSTAPEEGGALAMAVLATLRDRGTRTVAATHLGLLKVFAARETGMVNAAMEYRDRPTFRLVMNVVGTSNAFELAHQLGLGDELVARARSFMDAKWLELNAYLRELETARRDCTERSAGLARETEALARARAEYEARLARFTDDARSERRRLRQEAETFLARARADFDALVRELRTSQASRATIRAGLDFFTDRQAHLPDPLEPAAAAADYQPAVGDRVRSRSLKREGVVASVSARDAVVQFGRVKMTVPGTDLEPAPGTARPEPAAAPPDQHFEPRLSLLGLTGDEAEDRLDQFLDQALLAGLREVVIVHGKGLGVLRTRVAERLRRDPRVASFRLGERGEGGDGVTVVVRAGAGEPEPEAPA